MQYRIDERTGNKLSALGFGCMRFPRGVSGINLQKAEQIILRAIEAGVNYFDTAYIYAGSEAVLGTILARNNVRDKVYIATKLPVMSCRTFDDIERIFNAQLAALHTDYIDYYLMHNINSLEQWNELCSLGIIDWLAVKKAEGKVRRIGFSFHGAKDEFTLLLDAYDWDFCQIQYNYANENYQAGVSGLKKAAERHIPVIIMEPLLGGKLANGLPPSAVEIFRQTEQNRSPAAWGLRWLWNQPEVTVVLSGMNELSQLEDNVAEVETALPEILSEPEKNAYEKVVEIFKTADKIPCTGCAYCMPCPQGVNIPACFASYNASYVHGRITSYTMYVTSTAANRSGNALASKCVGCHKCETHCPQQIKISKSLEAVAKRMEPFYFKQIMKIVRSRAKK